MMPTALAEAQVSLGPQVTLYVRRDDPGLSGTEAVASGVTVEYVSPGRRKGFHRSGCRGRRLRPVLSWRAVGGATSRLFRSAPWRASFVPTSVVSAFWRVRYESTYGR